MKEITPPVDKAGRWAMGVLSALFACMGLLFSFVPGDGIVAGVTVCAFTLLIFLGGVGGAPRIWIGDEGFQVKYLFRRRMFHWGQVVQAGILYIPLVYRRGYNENYFCILLPGASPRRYRDKTFFFRNIGKIVEFPNTPEIREYVIRHYGPLDFNLTDGQSEQSVEID